jgi:hypothetical protein
MLMDPSMNRLSACPERPFGAASAITKPAGNTDQNGGTVRVLPDPALTGDSVEMEFLTGDPVAHALTYQRVTFDARAPRCGRYGCATAGRVSWT